MATELEELDPWWPSLTPDDVKIDGPYAEDEFNTTELFIVSLPVPDKSTSALKSDNEVLLGVGDRLSTWEEEPPPNLMVDGVVLKAEERGGTGCFLVLSSAKGPE